MILVRRGFVMTVLLLGIASPVASNAFFDPPYITPTNPTAEQDVAVNVHGGYCDAIFGHPGDPSYPHIERDGNRITVTYFGARFTNIELCYYPPGTVTTLLGTFPQGAYDVEVLLYYMNGVGDFQTDIIGTTSFVVTGAPPPNPQAVAAPTLGRVAILLLAIFLPGIGVVALRAARLAPRRS